MTPETVEQARRDEEFMERVITTMPEFQDRDPGFMTFRERQLGRALIAAVRASERQQRDQLVAALMDLCDAIPDATVADDPTLGCWIAAARAALTTAGENTP